MIVKGWPLMIILRPTTVGSDANRELQIRVREHRDGMTILQSVIVWRDHATDCRPDAEHGEVGARDDLSSDPFGPARIGNVEVVPESPEYTREHLIVIAEVRVHRE